LRRAFFGGGRGWCCGLPRHAGKSCMTKGRLAFRLNLVWLTEQQAAPLLSALVLMNKPRGQNLRAHSRGLCSGCRRPADPSALLGMTNRRGALPLIVVTGDGQSGSTDVHSSPNSPLRVGLLPRQARDDKRAVLPVGSGYWLRGTADWLYFFQRLDSSYIVLTSVRCKMFSAPGSLRIASNAWAASR
jgi:hypothetical protein